MPTTTNVSPLIINYLTDSQYQTARTNGTLNENQLYLTPSSGSLSDYLPLAGGTMTGNLTIKYTDRDFTTAPSAAWTSDSVAVTDSNDMLGNMFRTGQDANGVLVSTIGARRAISGTTYFNALTFKIANDGTRTIEISEKEPWINALTASKQSEWRTALGLGTMATEASTSYIKTSGTTTISGNVILSGGYLSLVSNGYNINTAGNTALTFLSISNTSNSKSRWNVGIDANNQITFGAFTANSSAIAEYYRLPKPDATSETIYEILTGKGGSLVAGKHIDVNASGSWWQGRDKAAVRNWGTTSTNYRPIISGKTNTGSWEIGPYNENLNFTYVTDTVYNSGTNTGYKTWAIDTDGVFSGHTRGITTTQSDGYTTDNYGNFKHLTTTSTNTWGLINNAGTNTFTINFESGETKVVGSSYFKSIATNGMKSSVTPTAARYVGMLAGVDADGAERGILRLFDYTDGNQGMAFLVSRSISGTSYYNEIRVGLTNTGAKTIYVSDASVWRSALGLGSMATQSSSSYLALTGGTLTGDVTGTSFVGTGSFKIKTDGNPVWPFQVYSSSNQSRAVIAVDGNNRLYFPEFTTAGTSTTREDYRLPTPNNTSGAQTNYDIVTSKYFQCGVVAASNVSANSRAEKTVTFTTSYTNTPTVIVSLYSSGSNAGFGNTQVHVKSFTASNGKTTGFAVELSNASSATRSMGFHWMAYASS